jgi:hypothetical protein
MLGREITRGKAEELQCPECGAGSLNLVESHSSFGAGGVDMSTVCNKRGTEELGDPYTKASKFVRISIFLDCNKCGISTSLSLSDYKEEGTRLRWGDILRASNKRESRGYTITVRVRLSKDPDKDVDTVEVPVYTEVYDTPDKELAYAYGDMIALAVKTALDEHEDMFAFTSACGVGRLISLSAAFKMAGESIANMHIAGAVSYVSNGSVEK